MTSSKLTPNDHERIRERMRTNPTRGWQAEMANELGVSRERVRQIAVRLRKQDPSLPSWTPRPKKVREKKGYPLRKGDLTGQQFGRWTVVSRSPHPKVTMWNCLCKCGNEKVVIGAYLRRGLSKSCGCYRRERMLQVWGNL